MNAETAGHVGTATLKQLNMVNIEMFRHPKYYKELRLRNKSDQVISANKRDGGMKVRALDPGQELGQVQPCDREATPSSKHQASSNKLKEPQASSGKHQAPSNKPQA